MPLTVIVWSAFTVKVTPLLVLVYGSVSAMLTMFLPLTYTSAASMLVMATGELGVGVPDCVERPNSASALGGTAAASCAVTSVPPMAASIAPDSDERTSLASFGTLMLPSCTVVVHSGCSSRMPSTVSGSSATAVFRPSMAS